MNTEITDKMDDASGGWVFYDTECARCRRWAASLQPRLAGRGFALAPLQSPQARATLRLSDEALLAEMRVVTRQGRVVVGADALLYLARNLGGGKMIDALVRVPGLRLLLRRLYRYVARNRSCAGGICRTTARNRPALNRTAWKGGAL